MAKVITASIPEKMTTKMASIIYSKFNIMFFIFSTQTLAEATDYLSHNIVKTNETPEQIYSDIPQEYFLPYQKYIPSFNHNYIISQLESQIPVAVSSTEKTLYSSAYKVPVDSTKYVATQVIKPPQDERSNQVSYPYTALVKEVPPTVSTHRTLSNAGKDHSEDVPKKYHYGYRVSNPYTRSEFGHSEVNDGVSARGYYHVLLPDGRLQNVKYWAGPSGYHATITYETQY